MKSMIESAKELEQDLLRTRRAFHENPEVSGCEKETSALVRESLEKLGLEVRDHVAGFGVVGILRGGRPGKTVALRADMDALQITELNEAEYRSKREGVMHACGHDNHMTFLLGAAKLLTERREELAGSVKFIFQPAEERSPTGGSRGMIEEGALDGVDAVFGLHVWPALPHGKVGVKSGPLMAASDHFSVTIRGKSTHAGQPEGGIDAIVMGAQFVEAVQNIVSREVSPMKPAVVTIGRFHAGSRYNIVAETCTLEGTCRTLNEEVQSHVEKRLQDILDGICLMHRAEGELNYERGYIAVNNPEEMASLVERTASRLFGEEAAVRVAEPAMTAEDFAFYLKERPGAFFWLGTGTKEHVYPLHNSRFDVDEDILWRGAALLAQTALDYLEGR